MKTAIFSIASFSAIAVSSLAEAAVVKTTCARGGDARIIEVIAPGEVGQRCDVRYTRDGGANVSVPFHANSSETFCAEKSRELVQRLASAGFVCTAAPPALRAEAGPQSATSPNTAGAAATPASTTTPPGADYVVETQRAAAPEDPAPQTDVDDSMESVGAIEQPPIPVERTAGAIDPSADEAPLTAQAAIAPAPVSASLSAAEAVEADALEDEMSKILAQPSLDAASREPAQLVAQHAPVESSSPQPSSVGRLVGAAPETPQGATQVTQVAQTEPAPEPELQAQASSPDAAAQSPAPEKRSAGDAKIRTPEDVVRATLMAQAAAWNEGDLEGFMESYWKSDRLKFVSGVSTTRGWDATLKRYRDRYSGGGLGRLGFDRIDVELVTDDVAVVTGRFNHDRDGETSSGLFSLVMRRDNGAWRIVHDHTSADPASDG
ncbi:MAG: nuclear transport factor 2 family protein [Pseudomonadota bacterium]